ncbi:hypothetical protein ACFVT2_17210 [Streptomyces sp. NPDC058000]|uniref:allene oxide cyclase barrel-like domain-containing protein n=1 Tax=Streptomyces sp. NPDC058000 TaxID=3346299 RepID=UPI0036E814C9
MRVRPSLLRPVSIAASVLAVLSLSAATAAPSAASTARARTTTSPAEKSCITHELKEPQLKNLQNVNVPDPRPGQIGIYYDELRDAHGAYAGTVMGRYEIKKHVPRGPVWTYYTDDLFLPDGVIHAEGWVDFNDVKNTKWVGYRATGLDGVYKGRTGVREWRNTGVDGAPVPAFLRLCK